ATWLREEMLDLLAGVSDEEFTRKPAKGRPIRKIVEHVFGAEYGYVRRFGKIEGVKGPGAIEAMDRGELMEWMGFVREREMARLHAFTDEELGAVDQAGSQVKTVRSYMRKLLAHQWEHLVEIRQRP
ncbi:MAG: DinB family protein, partial [Tepidiformaceae bacterium]